MTNKEVNDVILNKFQEKLGNTITVTENLSRIFGDWFQSLVQGAVTNRQQQQVSQQQTMPQQSTPPTSDPQGAMQEAQGAA